MRLEMDFLVYFFVLFDLLYYYPSQIETPLQGSTHLPSHLCHLVRQKVWKEMKTEEDFSKFYPFPTHFPLFRIYEAKAVGKAGNFL